MIPSTDQTSTLSEFIKTEAIRLGFTNCGISRAGFLADSKEKVEHWLNAKMHAEMTFLEKNKEKRYDPTLLVEGAKSVISVLYNYYPEQHLEIKDNYKISKYAYGKDYHYVIKEKLKVLLDLIEMKTGKRKARVFVDSAPVLDRVWAHKSGLGFIGKNTLIISKKAGSFFFIGHIILDLELKYEEQSLPNYCGSCTKCIDACPTDALTAFQVDARKCISYHTIEYRGPSLPQDLKNKINDQIFGCDICQDVCPWNRFSKPHNEPLFALSEELKRMRKPDWQTLDRKTYKELFKGTAVERTRFKGLKRNISLISD